MKTKRHYIALLFVIVLIIPFNAHATDDTDVYDISTNVKPNVLIIFDNSGSMDTGVAYNDSDTYAGSYNNGPTDYYERECLDWGYYGCRDWGPWEVYTGTFTDTNSDGIHDSDTNIRKGNRLNFDYGDYDNRLGVAKQAINNIIDQTKDDVRFGIMVLNANVDINAGFSNYMNYQTDTTVLSSGEGGAIIEDRDNAEIETLKGFINGMTANGGTPLANRLINAAKYYRGTFGSYGSPLNATNWCRENFVIIMTDGIPEGEGDYRDFPADGQGTRWANNDGEYEHIETFLDGNPGSRDVDSDSNDPDPSNNYINGGSDYLDDLAKYLYETEDSLDPTHAIAGNQNLIIYTIGFHVDHQLLSDTAANAGGDYYTTSSSIGLADALVRVMESIVDRAQTFTAPVVPVQRTTSGDKMYISLFTPKSTDNFWPGYLVKLGIGSNGELMGFSDGYAGSSETQVTDSYGTLHEDLIRSDRAPYPYWDAQQVLKNTNEASRKIFTYLNVSKDLDHSSNAFLTTNSSNLTAQKLGNPSDRVALIKYFRGLDSYDEDGDSIVDEKRDEILGDILHSKPLIIDYEASNTSNPQRVIYVGTNDGMLHAFNDTDGSEKWAFIPPDLLPKLKDIVVGTGHPYYVDGSPQAYILDNDGDGDIETPDQDSNYDKVIIVFGERRGGTSYCALDVTNPNDPQFLWRIDNIDNSSTYGIPAPDVVITEMGQSWSDPVIGKVKAGTVGSETDTIVVIIGGGFNDDTPSHTKGRGLFIINVLTGALVKSYTIADSGTYPVLANMTSCIPSTVLAVDTTFDGYINRVYVGDLGGQIWRFGLHRTDSGDTRLEDGNVNNWTPRRLFSVTGTTARKIFYTPDLVLEPGYAYLYFGTGDRTDPMDIPSPVTGNEDRFYAVKDKNDYNDSFTTLTESDLYDVTDDLIQEGTTAEKAQAAADLAAGDGWYIMLEDYAGEKVLAPPTVIFGMVLFTTFTPLDTAANPCSYGGDARLYVVNYLTAASIIDWDTDTDLDKADRSIHIGQGIPTEVVITLTDTGEVRGYVGAGGGIIHWDFTGSVPRFSVDAWREEF